MLVRGRQGRGLNFFYYAWLALALALLGSTQLLQPASLACFLLLLAAAAAYLGGRFDRITLRAHCAVACVLAAWHSGLPRICISAFVAPSLPDWTTGTPVPFQWYAPIS